MKHSEFQKRAVEIKDRAVEFERSPPRWAIVLLGTAIIALATFIRVAA